MSLPAPLGPFAVGTTSVDDVDPARPRHLRDATPGRRLRLQLWYPAAPAGHARPERFGHSLRLDPRTPAGARLVLALIRTRTAAVRDAVALTPADEPAPVLYFPSLISFAAENTSLVESLASLGHVVIGVEHQDQLEEFRTLQREQPAAQRREASILAARLVRADPAERAALAKDYYTASPMTGAIVRERAADAISILDRYGARGAHLVGFSVGGAVAMACALRDDRALSVVSLDGGLQGSIDARALRTRALMLYSAANEGINDALLPAGARRETLAGTRHLNFHDIAGLFAPLKWTSLLGSADPTRILDRRNRTVCDFVGVAPKP